MARANNAPTPPIDTIYALSSGAPPAAIAIVRISGAAAGSIARERSRAVCRSRAAPRCAASATRHGDVLDHALLLWFPGPATATGEDLAELHLHGGRAVVAAVLARAGTISGCALAEPGEFTRRALFNGRLDLERGRGSCRPARRRDGKPAPRGAAAGRRDARPEARRHGCADLIGIAAAIEAAIDYDGEDDVAGQVGERRSAFAALVGEIDAALGVPPAERLRDGLRVVIVGPPNAGKSTLFNALVGGDAAIVSDDRRALRAMRSSGRCRLPACPSC